jgi:Xaa-Pro aminopeptidase
MKYPHRVAGVRTQMATPETTDNNQTTIASAVPAMVISHLENVRYLTGFTGSNGIVLLTEETAYFITDGRYTVQAKQQVPGFEIIILPQGSSLAAAVAEKAGELGIKTLGFETAYMTHAGYRAMQVSAPADTTLVPRNDVVEAVRAIKEPGEISAIKKAVAMVDACFGHICKVAKPGMTELDLAWEIEVFLRRECGADKLSFETIVASGPNAAMCHHHPGNRKLGESGGPEFVICDYGAESDGYCSDITRTIVINGDPTPRHHEIYNAVLEAQLLCLDAIKAGEHGRDIHFLTVESYKKRGLDEYFPHGLGHALGRVVHDGPMFSAKSPTILRAGMVGTVEPGLYIEGFGGVRIEDDIVITQNGCEILTTATKELQVV